MIVTALASLLPIVLKSVGLSDSQTDDAVKQVLANPELIELDKGQQAINLENAKSNDPFARRWRPALGWICVGAMGYETLIRPFCVGFGLEQFPSIEHAVDELMWVLLGNTTLRSIDKVTGKSPEAGLINLAKQFIGKQK